MMSAGVNPNHVFVEENSRTALHIAASLGYVTLVHLLIQAGLPIDLLDSEQHSALTISILNNQTDVVKYLVKAGAALMLKVSSMGPLMAVSSDFVTKGC